MTSYPERKGLNEHKHKSMPVVPENKQNSFFYIRFQSYKHVIRKPVPCEESFVHGTAFAFYVWYFGINKCLLRHQ